MAVKRAAGKQQLLKITLVRSLYGWTKKQQAVVRGLGLRRIHQSVIREKRPEILGMINKVPFMFRVEEVASDQSS